MVVYKWVEYEYCEDSFLWCHSRFLHPPMGWHHREWFLSHSLPICFSHLACHLYLRDTHL